MHEFSAAKFFAAQTNNHTPCVVLCSDQGAGCRYVVLAVTPIDRKDTGATVKDLGGLLAEVEVCKEEDMGGSSHSIRTHLGHLLSPGDVVWGYDLAHLSMSE